MVSSIRAVAAVIVAAAVSVMADSSIPTCGPGNNCPSSAPCCSQYGQCGVGAYCLGGCDPENSFDLKSCMPAPVCQSADYKMNSLDDVAANTEYLGDASQANWVSSGTPVVYNDQSILLTMAQSTVGTLLSSTHYVWYGKISATLTTSQGAGVVTAFIMMSDVKDEIDFEFVGVDLESAQSNFYFQGITDYNNELNLTVSNTVQNTHTYTFDWSPDTLTWAVDGVVMRTLNRNETYNATDGAYHYPQSPARVQLSLWPAGLASNGEGTVEWAGGLVDWNSPYMQNGYYYAQVVDVNVECYNPPDGYSNQGTSAYAYTSTAGTNNTVAITNDNTILGSFEASGDNASYNPEASSSRTSSASGSATASANPETVPGISGAGGRGDTGQVQEQGSSGTTTSAGNLATSTGSSDGSSGSSPSSGSGGFQQNSNGASSNTQHVTGSLVALVAFLAACMML